MHCMTIFIERNYCQLSAFVKKGLVLFQNNNYIICEFDYDRQYIYRPSQYF